MRLFRRARSAVLASVVLVLLAAPAARAAPPPNDNRADAQAIEAFPASIHGTLVEATVERLDPQVSECGPIAATVWYRIDTAPDGTLSFALRGAAGVAPVMRVYARGSSALREVTCGAADSGSVAKASFDTTRGANYFVLVGRKPASADGEFDLQVSLTLPPEPPANDRFAAARRLTRLPVTLTGTTVGARSEEGDPEGCDLAGGTVWYRLKPAHDGLVLLKLHANGKLDAVVGVLARARSRLAPGSCRQTNERGDASLAFRGIHTTTYFVVVGQQQGSKAGTFRLTALAAAAAEQFPGRALPGRLVRATLNGLTNVNDVWHTDLTAGTTYRLAFASTGCARADLIRRTDRAVLVSLSCRGYRTFTPGPDGGGMYVIQVSAAPTDRAQPYRLQFARSEPDDIGIGLPLANQTVRPGRLDPGGIDIVDIYHFDVERRSDVTLGLTAPSSASFRLVLVTESGGRVGGGDNRVRQTLEPGRYVVAVTAEPSTPGGGYKLSLLVRDLTTTVMSVPSGTIPVGSAVALRPVVTPAATGWVEIQIDRFDPLTGWQFTRLVRVQVGGSVTWVPPSAGIWRVRATYLGSTNSSQSRSGYTSLTVR
jgi:hypothetical protein